MGPLCNQQMRIALRAVEKKLCNMVLTDQAKAEARDAFVVFDENYEGDNIDAFYLGDICRALGCNCTNGTLKSVGMTDEIGQKRITFEEFLPILEQVKADKKDTGLREDYIEGLKVFDKTGDGLISMSELQSVLCSLGEKLEAHESTELFRLLDISEDEDGQIDYQDFIDKLLAACV